MRKITILICGMFLISITGLFAQNRLELIPKFGVNLSGTHFIQTIPESDTYDVNMGMFAGINLLYTLNRNFKVGIGASYQLPREVKKTDAGEFNFFPVYAMAKLDLMNFGRARFGVGLQYGYNILYEGNEQYQQIFDLKPRDHYGIGVHLNLNKKLLIEALFTREAGEISIGKVFHESYSVSIGYIFTLFK